MTVRMASVWILGGNILAVLLALVIYGAGGRDHFGERGFITFLSTFQLLAIAGLSYKIRQTKSHQRNASEKVSAVVLWRVITWGFVFLAADEFLSLHEVADLFIHDIFNLRETGLSDRLDDIIVGLYGAVGVWVVMHYRQEFTAHKIAIGFFKKGFILLFVMVGLDLLTNEQDLLEIFFNPELSNSIQTQVFHLEDSLKLLAEAFFALAFYAILKSVKSASKKLEYSHAASQLEVEQFRH